MEFHLLELVDNSPLLSTIIGTIVATVIIFFGTQLLKKIERKEPTDNEIEISRNQFIQLNKRWMSKRRNLLAKKSFELNLKILKNDPKFINDWKELPLLAHKNWIPTSPIQIRSVISNLVKEVPPSIKPNTNILPTTQNGKDFSSYHSAMLELNKPKIFMDNDHFRLMRLEVEKDKVILSLSEVPSNYFKKIDYGKLAEYEFTKNIQQVNKESITELPNYLEKLPSKKTQKFRSKILSSVKEKGIFKDTVILGGVSTLTLILDENDDFRFLMHIRSSEQGYAEGTRHVIPAGEFQPLNEGQNFKTDTNILYTVLREYAEEIDGFEEFTGDKNSRFDYETNLPFSEYLNELDQENFKIYYLGFGLDPLSLQGEHLTCAIFKQETFQKLFGRRVKKGNDEGEIISDSNIWGLKFNEENIEDQYIKNILPAGEAILRLVEKNIDWLKNDFLS